MRKQDVSKIPKRFQWEFQTKLEQATDLVIRAAKLLQHHGKQVWCVAAHADETVGLGPFGTGAGAPGGLALGSN